jgi:lipopolysaccharide/colanic/teichoic acid biosynthesis glycosyltransferase
MKTVSNEGYKSDYPSINDSPNTDTIAKEIQLPQPEFLCGTETEIYSKEGLLLKGNSKYFSFWSFIFDFSILLLAIFLMNFIKYDTLSLGIIQTKLLFLFLAVWLFVSIFLNKFHIDSYPNYKKGIIFIVKSWLGVFFISVNLLVVLEIYHISHVLFFGICLLHITLEIALFSIYSLTRVQEIRENPITQIDGITKDRHFSVRHWLLDFVAFVVSILLINYFKHHSFKISSQFDGLIIITFGIWFLSGIFTCKFELRTYKNIYYKISPFIKSFLIHFSLMAVVLYTFRLYLSPKVLLLGSILLLLFFELLAVLSKHIFILTKGNNGDINSYLNIRNLFKAEKPHPIKLTTTIKRFLHLEPADEALKNYLKEEPTLYSFIQKNLNLKTIDQRIIRVLNTTKPFNIQILENHSLRLLINLHKINDFRYLNRHFILAHQKIQNGGFFIGHAHTIDTHKVWFNEKYPKYMGKILYPFDFAYRRILPKLPKIRKLYFYLTKGKNRIISKTEILGRLCFCGFEIIAWDEIDNRLYFIAQKITNPKIDKNPSYNPIIKLRRVGLHGKIIYIGKFRTMYPYAEYLQDTIFEKHKLNSNGKFQNDFRITEWGKCFRKLWLDELPQIINFWKGDITLVGVRALSEHYFRLYPDDLKALRIQFKPGLIPPYYVDLPKSFSEIVDSEKKYLKRKKEHPFSTDIKYFFGAVFNILFKHARSQ